MRRVLVALWFSGVALVCSAHAQDAAGRRMFEQGVAAARAQRWDEARSHFEASLAEADKPATRFNLVLVYEQLGLPLQVARHALAFLALPEQAEHAAARGRARELLARAVAQLATLTTGALPPALQLRIDGAPPAAREPHRVYVTPGVHRLESLRAGAPVVSADVELAAGQIAPWPEARPNAAQPQAVHIAVTQPAPAQSELAVVGAARAGPRDAERTRTQLAWTFGSMGAAIQLSALGVYLGALHRADAFGERDLFQPGVVEARDDALRLQNAVAPLALAGGALMASAVVTGARATRAGSLGWSVGALASGAAMAGAGLALAVHEPPSVPGSRLPEPRRQAGYLLATSALPLFAYGVGFLVARQRGRARHDRAAIPLGVRW